MLLGPDKELKILKQSRLMQVSEFSSMVSSLERFKQDLAVRALTGGLYIWYCLLDLLFVVGSIK